MRSTFRKTPDSAVRRLSIYLRALEDLEGEGVFQQDVNRVLEVEFLSFSLVGRGAPR